MSLNLDWLQQNDQLLYLLNSRELTVKAVIWAKDRIIQDGLQPDPVVFENLIELAEKRERTIAKTATMEEIYFATQDGNPYP